MKRFLAVLALLLAVVALATSAFESKARPVDNNQFVGIAKYADGDPVLPGTLVIAYRDGEEVGRTTIWGTNGYYQIRGDDNEFPTDSYTLYADDGVGMLTWEYDVNHTIHVTTERDLVLKTAY